MSNPERSTPEPELLAPFYIAVARAEELFDSGMKRDDAMRAIWEEIKEMDFAEYALDEANDRYTELRGYQIHAERTARETKNQ